MAMVAPIAQPISFSFRLRACSGLIDRPLLLGRKLSKLSGGALRKTSDGQ